MSKTIDGIELLKMIKDGKIPYRTKINIVSDDETLKFYTIYGEYRQLHLIRDDNGKIKDIRCIDTEDLLTYKFEIVEQEEIDIQGLAEIPGLIHVLDVDKMNDNIDILVNQCNYLVQAVKQLDNKIKEVSE